MKKSLLFLSSALFVSSFGYSQWTPQATGFTSPSRGVKDITIFDVNNVWALATDGVSGSTEVVQEFTKTTNGGTTWTPGIIDLADPALDINNLSAVSMSTAWVSATDVTTSPTAGPWPGGIWKTTDGGASWFQQNTNGYIDANSFLNVVHFFNETTGISEGDPITSDFEVYRTTDGGDTWTPIAATIPNAASGEAGYNGGNIAAGSSFWFVTNKGKLYRTTDQGANWSKLSTPISDFAGTAVGGNIYFSDDNIGVLLARTGSGTSATYKIYSTTNGGTSWSATGTPTTYTSLGYIPGTTTLIGTNTTDSGYSLDNGVTWTSLDSGTQRTYVSFLNNNTGWAGGFTVDEFTGGIYKYTGAALAVSSVTVNNKLTVFPNPTNSSININSTVNTINEVSVYNLLGKQVLNTKFSAVNNANVDLSSLQSGVYLLNATSDKGAVETFKIVKN